MIIEMTTNPKSTRLHPKKSPVHQGEQERGSREKVSKMKFCKIRGEWKVCSRGGWKADPGESSQLVKC